MKKHDAQGYLNILAKKLLCRLEIDSPSAKQMNYAVLILSIIGTLPEELFFEELLSTQEFECLYWAINGCNQSQIAKVMGISRETVKGYLERIKKKYHSKTITQAFYNGLKYHSLKRNFESVKKSLQEIAEGIILLVDDMK